jgi:hypothetical protein
MRRARALASVDSAPRRSLEAVARPVLVPAPAIEAEEPTDASLSVGPDGLPKRVRQASLAPQLRGEPTGPLTPDRVDPEPPPRSAEQARATMAALQAGTARGRRDADAIPPTRDSGALPLARRGGEDTSAGPGPVARGTASPPPGTVVTPPANGAAGEPPEVIDGLPRRKRAADAPPSRRVNAEGPPARKSAAGGLPRRRAGEGLPTRQPGVAGTEAFEVPGADPSPADANGDGKHPADKTPPGEPEGDV